MSCLNCFVGLTESAPRTSRRPKLNCSKHRARYCSWYVRSSYCSSPLRTSGIVKFIHTRHSKYRSRTRQLVAWCGWDWRLLNCCLARPSRRGQKTRRDVICSRLKMDNGIASRPKSPRYYTPLHPDPSPVWKARRPSWPSQTLDKLLHYNASDTLVPPPIVAADAEKVTELCLYKCSSCDTA
ncbi:uncharacterized protein LY79DRAFT_401022 [Colletotrichum navitas]|uniref:Uncharacterized protein n=1 Tax=Colletotrichum navitas TaxID=681940 RepID=A0AAD8PPP4_9PEZI|nr:uncharacterized protein LY79DRAFT_401022 [Colletotrichum navitas]KAK1573678.1 hypothetical protein LY79DRAFT_401022 [Colletotrichum navitas]